MSEDHFRLIYDGPAVQDGEMEVGQLAPSLLALGKLVEQMDALATGEVGRVRVKVRADVRHGSFDIGLSLDFIHAVSAWFDTPGSAKTLAILSLLGISAKDGVVGLIQAVRWLRRRRIAARRTLRDGNIEIEVDDGDTITVPSIVARAVDDAPIRQQLERFTEPLREDGVEVIRFEERGKVSEEIVDREASAFEAVGGDEPTSVSRFPATYQIKRLYFERGRKWRVSNGAQTIMAEIEDDTFWARVDQSEIAFASGDYLRCDVRMDQWLSAAGLKTEYAIERVVEHIPAPKQDRFPGT